jgi:hypothetical protein
MNWKNFAPRAGAAYQITPKLVARAGYGWGYDVGVFGSNFGHNVTQNPPVLSNQNINNNTDNWNSVFNLAQGPSAPATPVISSNGTFPLPAGINPKFRPATVTLPTTYIYNGALQYQVTNRIAVTGAYVGNSNRHGFLGSGQSINPNEAQFIPGVGGVRPLSGILPYGNDLSYYCDCSNASYNSFQGQVRVNAWDGWTVQGSYTYQEQWGPGFAYDSNYYFLYNRAAGEGTANTFAHNQITIAQSYDVPFGRGKKYGANISRWADYAIGGWNISGVMTYYSGFPFSPTIDNYTGKPSVGPNNRPNIGTGSPTSGAAQNRSQWFVGCSTASMLAGTCAGFTNPAANTFGNYPIDTLIGPQFIQQDISVAKSFAITERVAFKLRTDARNAFNHTNLGSPNSDVNASNAGQITGLAGGGYMRSLQFSGTISF